MQTIPAGWAEVRRGLYRWETKVVIAGVEYGESAIYSLSTSAALFSSGSASIGGCVAKEIDLTVMPSGTIPRMAEIRVYVRPYAVGIETEWLQKGVYFIDTRQIDRVSGRLTIHGYDAMLKAEQAFLGESEEGGWPRSMTAVVEEIADRMGVGIDSRTVINSAFVAEYPGDLTMREMLSYIAVAHAGNWIITDSGDLRLVGLADTPPETYYLIDEEGDVIVFGDTRILV